MKKTLLGNAGFLGVAVAMAAGACQMARAGNGSVPQPTPKPQPTAAGKVKKLSNGLIIEDLKVGDGAEAKSGQNVTVHYIGTLTNGTKFDASRDHGQPFTFKLGAGMVIKGWDQGVAGMKIGGKRKLTIPADLAYGAASPAPSIPPNSTLVFEVDLLKIG